MRLCCGVAYPLKLLGIAAALAAGIIEEISFRGFIMTRLQAIGVPAMFQVLHSGIVFGLAHLYTFSTGGFIATTVLGLLFAGIYIIGKRSLTPTVASHSHIDLITEPWLLMAALAGF
jgi:hypothetical protein